MQFSAADLQLAEEISQFYADPYGFVLFAFPWHSSDLSSFGGPEQWQKRLLLDLGAQIRERGFDQINSVTPIRMGRSSGHGIGKSALVSWLINFILSTRRDSKGVVTANTNDQLRTKTWAELGKWHKRCITKNWFDYYSSRGNLSLQSKINPEFWRVDGQTCREENSESFAGLHAVTSTPFYIFDEASAVPDKIFEVSEGGTTDGEPMWFIFGNPTRNSGKFYQCMFGSMRNRWRGECIDSREVTITNKERIQEWADDYGEDSDFFRVRVKGLPPSAASTQFVSKDVIFSAQKRPVIEDHGASVIVGVDVARFGDNSSVIWTRMGRDARSIPKIVLPHQDTHQLANRVAEHVEWLCENGYGCELVNIDGGGVGGGVVDKLKFLISNYTEVNFGENAQDSSKYANRGTEMWARMRDWLTTGCIPQDTEMEQELLAREYGFNGKDAMILESKKDMKKRGMPSPDNSDALALTFAVRVPRRDMVGRRKPRMRAMAVSEYQVLDGVPDYVQAQD